MKPTLALAQTLTLHLVKILALHPLKTLALHLEKTITVTPPLMAKGIMCSCMEPLARVSDHERGVFSLQAGKCIGLRVTRSKVEFVTPTFSYDSALVLASTAAKIGNLINQEFLNKPMNQTPTINQLIIKQ